METQILQPDVPGFASAAQILSTGGLVAFPTETVYGLGADARNGAAVAAIYTAKGRPSFNPLIVHVADMEAAKRIAVFDDIATQLADAFWPGPLTLVLPLQPNSGVSELVSAGLQTIALRIPSNEVAHQMLSAFAGPIAAPSANPSGRISATRAEHVFQGLGGKIDAIIDGGPCNVGLESTIVMPRKDGVFLLRAGGLEITKITEVAGQLIQETTLPDAPTSPGQLLSHYAPNAPLRINVVDPQPDELFIGFGAENAGLISLSETGDLAQAAANLFWALHKAENWLSKHGKARIAVAPVPNVGLGIAINDRLRRAAYDPEAP